MVSGTGVHGNVEALGVRDRGVMPAGAGRVSATRRPLRTPCAAAGAGERASTGGFPTAGRVPSSMARDTSTCSAGRDHRRVFRPAHRQMRTPALGSSGHCNSAEARVYDHRRGVEEGLAVAFVKAGLMRLGARYAEMARLRFGETARERDPRPRAGARDR